MLEGIPWVPSVGVGVLDTLRGPCRGAWTPYILQAVVDVVDLMLLPLLHVEQHDNSRTEHRQRMESFNGKLRDELLDREIFYTLTEAKIVIERWRREYNMVRSHSTLGYQGVALSSILVGGNCAPRGKPHVLTLGSLLPGSNVPEHHLHVVVEPRGVRLPDGPEFSDDRPCLLAHAVIRPSTIGNFSGRINAGNVAGVATVRVRNSFSRKTRNVFRSGVEM